MHDNTDDSRATGIGGRLRRLINTSMPSITGEQYRAVFFAILMVGSIAFMPVIGGFDSGGVAASETTDSLDSKSLENLNTDVSTSVADSDMVYVGSDDGSLYAVDAETGEQEWVFNEPTSDIYSSPTVVGNTVYVGSDDGSLYAVDAETGEQEWVFNEPTGDLQSSPTVFDGTVYIGSMEGDDGSGLMYAVDAESGEKEWEFEAGRHIESSPTISNGTVYFASYDDYMYAVDAESGEKEWEFETGTSVSGSPTTSNGTVYLGARDNHLYAIDGESGEKEWDYETGDNIQGSPTISDGIVYIGSWDESLHAVNSKTGEQEWEFTEPIDNVDSSPTVADGIVYVGSSDNFVYAVDATTGDQLWDYDTGDRVLASPTVYDGTVYVGSRDESLYALESMTGEVDWKFEEPTDYVYSSATVVPAGSDQSEDSRVKLQTLGHHAGDAGDPITGQVTDQSGDPVDQATVSAVGHNPPNFDQSVVDDLQLEAENTEELIDELENSVPDEYEDFADDYLDDSLDDLGDFGAVGERFDAEAFADDIDATYPMVHHEDDWGTGATTIIEDEVENPRLQVDPGESLVLSLWDPSESGGMVDTSPIRSSHPGAPTDGTITVQQIDPAGDGIQTTDHDTSTEFVEERTYPLSDREWDAVRTELPQGLYRVYPDGHPERATIVTVGEPEDITSQFVGDLRNEADQLTQRAEQLTGLLEEDMIVNERTSTDDNGEFELDVPADAENVQLQAYKGDSELIDALEEIREDEFDEDNPPSIDDIQMSDLRDYQSDFDFNGSFHMPAETNRVSPGEQNVTVQTFGTSDLPFGDMGRYGSIQDFLQEQRLDERTEELRNEYDERFDEMERDSLERIYTQHKSLAETVPRAEDRYVDRSDYDELQDAEDLSRSELTTETNHLQIAVANVADLEMPDTTDPFDIEDGELEAEIPLPAGLDTDTIAPEIHWADGTAEEIDEEYWDVESGGLFGGDTLSVSGVPINGDDAGAFDLRVQGANSDGILDGRISGTNPAFDGTIPQIDAINWNTIAPGPDERLYVGLDGDLENGYEQLTGVEAIGPDGDELETEIDEDRDRASFRTVDEGVHNVRLTLESTSGDEFTITDRVRAGEQSRPDPATIRATKSPLGTHAVVGDDLSSARVDTSGDEIQIDALVDSQSDAPGELQIKPDAVLEGTDHTIDVSILHGSDEQTVQSHATIYVHLDTYGEETIASVNDRSITQDGETRWGEVDWRDDGDKAVLVTITDEDGNAEISLNQDPDRLDRLWHWVDYNVWTPGFFSSVVAPLLQFIVTISAEVAVAAETGVAAATTTMHASATTTTTTMTAGASMAGASGVIST